MEKVIKKTTERTDYAVRGADFVEQKEQEKIPRLFTIWHIEPLPAKTLIKTNVNETENFFSDQRKLVALEKERLAEVKKDENKRPFLVRGLKNTDLNGELETAYHFSRQLEGVPEIIILRNDKEIYESQLGGAEVKLIRERVHNFLKEKGLEKKENLLQPIITVVIKGQGWSVSADKIKEWLVEQGANLVIDDFQIEDIKELVQLVAKIKSDPASLAPERVKGEKKRFYEKVGGLSMGERSQVTADTAQELEILKEIFKKHQVKDILDIGCGAGRIDAYLAKDESLGITGLDQDEKLLLKAEQQVYGKKNVKFIKGDLIDYTNQKVVKNNTKDAVIYTWHSILEAFGPGNLLKTLNSAWLKLKKGGVLIFDMPTRENLDMVDGWYYNKVDKDVEYLSYLMTEDEIRFILRITGFDEKSLEIKKWQTKPSEVYPQGMKKITVVAGKS